MRKLIQNGLVYDGLGSAPKRMDVLVENDKIIRMESGIAASEADEVFDAKGYAVTPGFVDMHRHCDKSPLERQQGKGSQDYGKVMLRQGITSVATGNCGISMYPLSQDAAVVKEMRDYYAPVLGNIEAYDEITDYKSYMGALARCDLPLNTAAMIGMGAVRIAVKGFAESPFTKEEITASQKIIEEAMKEGAAGVSIGLMYLPEVYETVEELGEILKPVGVYGGILTAHIRGEGDSLVKSVEEVLEIGERAGCRVEISHFKSCGMKNWNQEIFKAIALIDAARAKGQEVGCDFYPYDCGSTTLMSMIPPAFVAGSIPEALKKMATEEGKEELREKLRLTYQDWDNYAISLGWDKVIISAVNEERNQRVIGMSIPEIVEAFGYTDAVDAACDLLVSEKGTVAIIIRSMDQKDIDEIAKLSYSCLISDAIYAETDRPHPRMYGSFPRMVREYVGERKVLTLEDALRKMTSMPAERMGLTARGVLAVGNYADINVFDPQKLKDNATYTASTQLPTGLHYTFLNGELVVRDDEVLRENAGRVLYRG